MLRNIVLDTQIWLRFALKKLSTMHAVVVNDDVMSIGEVERVKLHKSTDIVIKVKSTAVNRADVVQRKGFYPPPPGVSNVLGLEAAGVIVEVGKSCSKFKEGDRVAGILSGGGYAEYVCSNENNFFEIPGDMDFNTAASLPEVWVTSYQLIEVLANAKAGESILIHAGGSGVGTAAVQLAKKKGMVVFTTAGSVTKLQKVSQLGADVLINYNTESFDKEILQETKGVGVDIILDCIGGSYVSQNLNCLSMDGRWILYGFLGGSKVDPKILLKLFKKRAHLTATTLRNRSDEYKGRLVTAFESDVLPQISLGSLKPVIDATFDWTNVNEAHAHMECGGNFGKIVLTVES